MCAFANSDSNDATALSVHVSVEGGRHNNTIENYIDACAESYLAAGVKDREECCTCFTSF